MREKTGVFLPNEQFEKMNSDIEQGKVQIEDLEAQIEGKLKELEVITDLANKREKQLNTEIQIRKETEVFTYFLCFHNDFFFKY